MPRGNYPCPVTANPETALVDALLTASRSLLGIVIRSVESAPVAVTIPQHRVLVMLEDDGPLGIGVIAAELGVNPSNASRVCDRLQRLGLVERAQSPEDRRSVLVALTGEGRQVLQSVTDHRREEIARVVAQMDGRSTTAVVRALDSVSDAAGEVEQAVKGRGRDRSASS